MNLKDFFKPTKTKILIAAVLFVLFVPAVLVGSWSGCSNPPCPLSFALFKVSIAEMLSMFLSWGIENKSIGIEITTAVVGAALSYLAASLLVFLYSKYARGKSKR